MNQSTSSNQLNPYAIQLCTLGRWISAKQWTPAGSGNFSIRSGEHSALFTPQHKDKGELSPHELTPLSWQSGEASLNAQLSPGSLLHVALYQHFSSAKVVLQTQSLAATVLSKLIKADQHLFCGYDLQQVIAPQQNSNTGLSLAILDTNNPWPLIAGEIGRRQHELASGLLLRGQGLYVWADSLEQAKRQLEAWEFLISCELERFKVCGLL
jgi:methylthioribulose-1-phosphate dehydratase